MPKAIFSDLDGTLLTDQKLITPKNRAAIEAMTAAGHYFIVATGRPLASAIRQAEALELTGPGCCLIAFNGGILYNVFQREAFFRRTIPLPVVRRIFALARERGVYLHTYDEQQVLIEQDSPEEIAARYCGKIQMTYHFIPSIDYLKREPEKLLAIDFKDRTLLDPFMQQVLEQEGDTVDAFYSCQEYLEIVPKGMNKGAAVRQMASFLHIPIEDTIAAGDAENDITMLQAAGIGAAMQNSTPEVKAAADYVTTLDNNHDGLAEIIERFILK